MSKGNWGSKQGDMTPHVEDIARPEKSFPERGFSKTTEYVSRQDREQSKYSSKIKGQAYQGRYS